MSGKYSSMYRPINTFGNNAANITENNPLSYCLLSSIDSVFQHGAIAYTIDSPEGKQCQAFMSDRCSKNWDGYCEFASTYQKKLLPNNLQPCNQYGDAACNELTGGEILIGNSARKRFLTQEGNQCYLKWQPFDPTVASSPMISFWNNNCNGTTDNCVPVYEVNPNTIDHDVIMNKILNKPIIALDVLVNIYNTSKRKGTFEKLKGTKLYNFFMDKPFQQWNKLRLMKNTPRY
jgi:hypothetical protein